MTDRLTLTRAFEGAGIGSEAAERIATKADVERLELIRQYAAGEITWRALRERGIENYVEVLADLGRLGLRVPVAPMEGPNREARERGRAMLREWLKVS